LKRKKNLENIINIPLKPSMASVNVACTVKDEDTKGAIQPVVLIRKADGRFFYETVPDQKGNVEFDLEPKNDYTIEVFMNGYKTLKRTLSVKNEKQLKFDYLMKQNPTIFRLQVFDKETKSEIQSNYVIKRAWRNIAKGETDEDGRFNVKLERNAKYGIEIRNISFPLFENTFTTDKDTIDYQVYLDNDKTKIVNSADKPELVKQQLNEDLAVKSEFIHKKDPIVIGQKAKKEQNLIVEKVVEDGSDLDPIVENIEDETKAKQLVTHNKTITEYKHDEKESEFKEDEVTQFNDNAEKSVFKDDVEKFESDEDQSKFKESNKEFNQDAESNKDLDKVVKKNEFEGIEIKFLDKKSNKLLPAEFKVSKKVKKTNLKSNQTNELGLVKLKSKPEDVYVLNANLDGYIPIKKEFKSSTVGSELILVMEKRHVQGVRKIIKKRKKENTKKKREARVAVQTYKQPENKIIQKPKKVEKPVVIENNSEFYFNFGGTGLDKSSIRKLIRVNKNANSYIIESHTDTVGTSRYNLFLSFRRAFAFKKTLIKLGVDPKKIKYKCMGEKEPKYRENYRNRRVELHIK
jgi:outer membrane protein OmpA-like peptidoglycan-associated protein